MGLLGRVKNIASSKADKVLNKVEDPRAELDMAYDKQVELLRKVKQGLVEVTASRKRLEADVTKLNSQAETLQLQAQRALEANREDLAREALTRKAAVAAQISEQKPIYDNLLEQEEKLQNALVRTQAKVEEFRNKKEVLKAQYAAAQTQAKVQDAFSGISDDDLDAGNAMQRVEDKTLQLQARASATGELMDAGVLDDPLGMANDDLTRELNSLSGDVGIERELAAMKSSMLELQAGKGEDTPEVAEDAPKADSETENE